MNYIEILNNDKNFLKKNKIKNPILDSELLLSKVLNKSREEILLNSNYILKKQEINKFNSYLLRRKYNEPIAYILGFKYFWKYKFITNKSVLIPRPDTELIVEECLKYLPNNKSNKILDIGTGSGCILLTILKEKLNFYGTGIDISKKCIDITRINAIKLGVYDRLKLVKSDIDNFNYGKYDLIISNPPYIKKTDLKYLEKDVVNFEPILALNGGLKGLSEIRKVINKASKLIKTRGKLVLEIAFNQKYEIKKILNEKGFYINSVTKDYAANDRCIVSTKI